MNLNDINPSTDALLQDNSLQAKTQPALEIGAETTLEAVGSVIDTGLDIVSSDVAEGALEVASTLLSESGELLASLGEGVLSVIGEILS